MAIEINPGAAGSWQEAIARQLETLEGEDRLSVEWTDVTGKPSFATVATSGAYSDLSGLPSLFDGAWGSLSGIPAAVAGTTASFTTEQESKLAGLGTAAEADADDLLERGNHTGTQAIATVTGLQAALDAKLVQAAVATYAAKTTLVEGDRMAVFDTAADDAPKVATLTSVMLMLRQHFVTPMDCEGDPNAQRPANAKIVYWYNSPSKPVNIQPYDKWAEDD